MQSTLLSPGHIIQFYIHIQVLGLFSKIVMNACITPFHEKQCLI